MCRALINVPPDAIGDIRRSLKMRLERLTKENEHYFERAFALYESAFPKEERREIAEQQRAMQNPNYHFDLILEGETLLGVMLFWQTEEFIFLEHFTTMPEVRGRGLGAAALELLKEKGLPIILEIEPPCDEMTERRQAFYLRCGFSAAPYHHIQAKYHLGDEDLVLQIMSYPGVISAELYRSFYEYMTREIGILPNRASDAAVCKI